MAFGSIGLGLSFWFCAYVLFGLLNIAWLIGWFWIPLEVLVPDIVVSTVLEKSALASPNEKTQSMVVFFVVNFVGIAFLAVVPGTLFGRNRLRDRLPFYCVVIMFIRAVFHMDHFLGGK